MNPQLATQRHQADRTLMANAPDIQRDYFTPQALRRHDEYMNVEVDTGAPDDTADSVDLAEEDLPAAYPITTFKAKLVFQRSPNATTPGTVLGTLENPDEGLYLTSKISTDYHRNWTSSIRINIKAMRKSPSLVPGAFSKIEVLHTWTIRLNLDCNLEDLSIMDLPRVPRHRERFVENLFLGQCRDDTRARELREMGFMAFLRLTFEPQHAHTACVLTELSEAEELVANTHANLNAVFGAADNQRASLMAFICTTGEHTFFSQWAEFHKLMQIEAVYPPLRAWFRGPHHSERNPDKSVIDYNYITPREERPAVTLPYQRTYRNVQECWTIEGLSMIQAHESQRQLADNVSHLRCELRVLATTAGNARDYLGLLRLPDHFEYHFSSDDHFEIIIKDENWTAHILPIPFLYASTIDISVTLHRPLTPEGWSVLNIEHVLEMADLPYDPDHRVIQDFCHNGPYNTVMVRPIMNDKPQKYRIAAVKRLNPAHIGENGYEHNDSWTDLILGQDLRIQGPTFDIFDGADIYATLATWEIAVNDTTRAALEYFRRLPNRFGIVKGPWGTGKTWLDVIVALLLLHRGHKVKVLSPSNKSADTFIIKLKERMETLASKGIIVTDRAVVRFHAPSTEHEVIQKESQRFVPPPAEPDYTRQRFWIPYAMAPTMYDSLVYDLLRAGRLTGQHGVRDRRYKLHDASFATLVLGQAGLLDRPNPYATPAPADANQGGEATDNVPATHPTTGDAPVAEQAVEETATVPAAPPIAGLEQTAEHNEETTNTHEAPQNTEPGQNAEDPYITDDDGTVVDDGTADDHGAIIDEDNAVDEQEHAGHGNGGDHAAELADLQGQTQRRIEECQADPRGGLLALRELFRQYFIRDEIGEVFDRQDAALYKAAETAFSRHVMETNVGLVSTTLVNSGHRLVKDNFTANHVIVQEGATVKNADLFIAMGHHNGTMHMSGDDEQLGPHKDDTADNSFAVTTNTSLFERLFTLGYPSVLLTPQYRTIPLLGQMISTIWYEGKVQSAVRPAERPYVALATNVLRETYGIAQPIAFVSHNGRQSVMEVTHSKFNESEAAMAINLAATYVAAGIPAGHITILAGYMAQTRVVRRALTEREEVKDVAAYTVDGFQGEESPVVILCLVSSYNLGFMSSPNRLLSACSRARDSMVIICNIEGILSAPKSRFTFFLRELQTLFQQAGAFTVQNDQQPEFHFMPAERRFAQQQRARAAINPANNAADVAGDVEPVQGADDNHTADNWGTGEDQELGDNAAAHTGNTEDVQHTNDNAAADTGNTKDVQHAQGSVTNELGNAPSVAANDSTTAGTNGTSATTDTTSATVNTAVAGNITTTASNVNSPSDAHNTSSGDEYAPPSTWFFYG